MVNEHFLPEVEPFATGSLKVSDIHTLYWEQCGNPEGEPILYAETLYLLRPTWSDPIESSSILSDARDRIEENNMRRDW